MVVSRVNEVLAMVVFEDTTEIFGESPDPAIFDGLVLRAEARISQQGSPRNRAQFARVLASGKLLAD